MNHSLLFAQAKRLAEDKARKIKGWEERAKVFCPLCCRHYMLCSCPKTSYTPEGDSKSLGHRHKLKVRAGSANP